jgi:hypothetical protein
MRIGRKRWIILGLIALIPTGALIFARKYPPTTSDGVIIIFTGYTNLPGNELRFALFAVSNRAPHSIRWRGNWVEIEGNPHRMARTVNSNLPGYRYEPVLKSGATLDLAVGEPFYSSEGGRWRFSMSFARYTISARWFDYSFQHRLPLGIGPVVLVDSQQVLNPTNNVTASSGWLDK